MADFTQSRVKNHHLTQSSVTRAGPRISQSMRPQRASPFGETPKGQVVLQTSCQKVFYAHAYTAVSTLWILDCAEVGLSSLSLCWDPKYFKRPCWWRLKSSWIRNRVGCWIVTDVKVFITPRICVVGADWTTPTLNMEATCSSETVPIKTAVYPRTLKYVFLHVSGNIQLTVY